MEPKLALTVQEFCSLHSISRATFYNLLKAGAAPRTMRVGRRRFVSAEAATEWRREQEQAAYSSNASRGRLR
jgi:excisionase family DNA binding protein